MTNPDQASPQALYSQLMEEIKERMAVFRQFCVEEVNPKHGIPHARAHEFCYLELRFICELIALASLVAHGDISATKHPKLQRSYKPGLILDEMLKLNPEFYPQACVQKLDSQGRLVGWWTARDPLRQEDLKALWIECGEHLHRGMIKDIATPKKLDFWRLTQWHNKIMRLLNVHLICLIDRKSAYHVILRDERHDGVTLTPMDRWPSPDGNDHYAPRG